MLMRSFISDVAVLLFMFLPLVAEASCDSLAADTVPPRVTSDVAATAEKDDEDRGMSRYDRRVYRYRKLWSFLIPTQMVTQYAGNMGKFSMGIGWDYGSRRQYETNLLFGYLPGFRSSRAKVTMTLKQNFVPWRLPVGRDFNAEPLSFGVYFNTVFGHEFWGKQPKRYPDKYYEFLSTKVRVNVFVGQRFSVVVPHNQRKFIKGLTAFYEISTCDIYVRSMVQNGGVSLWDILGLSFGLKAQLF